MRPKKTYFNRAAIEGHIRATHSRMPTEIADYLADQISAREWRQPLTIGKALGLAAQAYVRHRLTDYERLLTVPGMTREEAQEIVQAEVVSIIDDWRSLKA